MKFEDYVFLTQKAKEIKSELMKDTEHLSGQTLDEVRAYNEGMINFFDKMCDVIKERIAGDMA